VYVPEEVEEADGAAMVPRRVEQVTLNPVGFRV